MEFALVLPFVLLVLLALLQTGVLVGSPARCRAARAGARVAAVGASDDAVAAAAEAGAGSIRPAWRRRSSAPAARGRP